MKDLYSILLYNGCFVTLPSASMKVRRRPLFTHVGQSYTWKFHLLYNKLILLTCITKGKGSRYSFTRKEWTSVLFKQRHNEVNPQNRWQVLWSPMVSFNTYLVEVKSFLTLRFNFPVVYRFVLIKVTFPFGNSTLGFSSCKDREKIEQV